MKFVYEQTKQMTPKNNQSFATTYYQMTDTQRERLLKHVSEVAQEIYEHAAATGTAGDLTEPLKGFPRLKGQPNYTAEDIITDFLGQLLQGKDAPSGMLGRWNRLFAEFPDVTVEMQDRIDYELERTQTYRTLFV